MQVEVVLGAGNPSKISCYVHEELVLFMSRNGVDALNRDSGSARFQNYDAANM